MKNTKSTSKGISECNEIGEDLARLAFLVESSRDAIIGKTLDGIITTWNRGAEQIYGYSADEAIDQCITMLAPPDRQDEVPRILTKLRRGERVQHFETIRVRKDGFQIYVSVSISPIYNASGKIIGASSIARDITERKLADEDIERMNKKMAAWASELETANRELEAFNYTVSHDLYKPITAINGYVQVIQEACGIKLDEQCRSYLREIYSGTLRMTKLIDSLLKFSRLTHVELHKDPVNLSEIAKGVAAELKVTASERKVTFRIAEEVTGKGDATLLRAVMENLLGNAWKYSAGRDVAFIEFGVAEAEGGAAYFVRDNGLGFDPDGAEKIFIPFTRLSGSEKFTGQGIGLATVDRIIKRHGGKIWAVGKPGEGATFFFSLPEV